MSAIRLVNLVRVRVKQVSKQLIVWEQKSRARPRTVQGLVLRARMAENNSLYPKGHKKKHCRVVGKLINTNQGLQVDRGLNFSCIKVFLLLMFVEFETSGRQNWKTENVNRKLTENVETSNSQGSGNNYFIIFFIRQEISKQKRRNDELNSEVNEERHKREQV